MASMILGGWLPDPPSSKDKTFDELRPRLLGASVGSDATHILPEKTPISHQGQLHSCAANVTADALEILMGMRGEVTQLSRLFIYYNARNYHASAGTDSGTYLRMAFEGLKRLGVCPEDLWPYEEANVALRPSLKAYHAANDYQVTGFYRIADQGVERADAVEAAIRANHPVAFGTEIGAEIEEYAGVNDEAFNLSDKPTGRHAMLWTGVRRRNGRREFWTRNSWGDSWGLKGHLWMSEEYVASEETRDVWVPTIMPPL